MLLSAKQLTNGERLFVIRRRAGNTQVVEAAQRGLPLGAYKAIELDQTDTLGYDIVAEATGPLTDAEVCTLLRRRDGLTLDDIATKVGLSKFYICMIEKGKAPVDTLLRYWEDETGVVEKAVRAQSA